MNKEECNKAIEIIDDYINGCALKEKPTKYEADEAIVVIDKLITEHFNNKPLKFEDLTMGMGCTVICDGKLYDVLINKIRDDGRVEYIWIDELGMSVHERVEFNTVEFYTHTDNLTSNSKRKEIIE